MTARIAALGLAASMHAAAVLAVLSPPEPMEPADDVTGAFFVEMSPTARAPTHQPVDLPPGPPAVEAAATPPSAPSPQAVARVPDREVPMLPQVDDAPTEIPVAKPPEEVRDTPAEEPQQVKQAVPAPVAAPSVASIAAAPPKVEDVPQAEKSAGPITGLSSRDRRLLAEWQTVLAVHLNRFKRFPEKGLKAGQAAPVLVSFVVDRTGTVTAVAIKRSSGHDVFDEEAINLVRRASPLPRPPPVLQGDTVEFIVPVHFKRR